MENSPDYIAVSSSIANALKNLTIGKKTFEKNYKKLKVESDATIKEVDDYLYYICTYQANFTKEVLKDFKLNRKHDRTTKKIMVVFMFIIFTMFLLGSILVALAYIFGWGEVERLDNLFKFSVFGLIIGGSVSLFSIIFKYIFNKKEDIFYRYSVDLFKHIVSDKRYITHKSNKTDDEETHDEDDSS